MPDDVAISLARESSRTLHRTALELVCLCVWSVLWFRFVLSRQTMRFDVFAIIFIQISFESRARETMQTVRIMGCLNWR